MFVVSVRRIMLLGVVLVRFRRAAAVVLVYLWSH